LVDKFCLSTFELPLVHVALLPSTVHAVFNIHRPQRSTSVAAFIDKLGEVTKSFAVSCADYIVILGDLNAPGINRLHIDAELAALFGMTQFVNSPTRGDSLLDVMKSVDSFAINSFLVNNAGQQFDH